MDYKDNKFYTLDSSNGEAPVKVMNGGSVTISKTALSEEQKNAVLDEAKNWKAVMYYSSCYENSLYQEEYYKEEYEVQDDLNIVTSNGRFAGFLCAVERLEKKICKVEEAAEFGLLLLPEFDKDGYHDKWSTNGNVIGHPVTSNVTFYLKRRDEKK